MAFQTVVIYIDFVFH